MYNGLDVLRPHLPKDAGHGSAAVVIGVVQGDTHDIGKNLVKIMLEAAGFRSMTWAATSSPALLSTRQKKSARALSACPH